MRHRLAPISIAIFIAIACVGLSPAARANPWVDLDAELDQRDRTPPTPRAGELEASPESEAWDGEGDWLPEELDGTDVPEPLESDELPADPRPPVPIPTPDEVQRAIPRPPAPSELNPPLPVPRAVKPPLPIPRDVEHPLGLPPARWKCRQLAFGLHCWTSDPRYRGPARRHDSPARRHAPIDGARSRCGSREESAAFALLNAERRKHGLPQLACDPAALSAARDHSADMCERRYFSHWSPEGASAGDRLRTAGARFESTGENIAMGQLTAARAHLSWLHSPGHRRNMLRREFTRAAVGMVQCEGALPYWTQVFLR